MNGTRNGIVIAAALTAGLGGCATHTPVSGKFPRITPRTAQSNRYVGTRVRWGGVLIKTNPKAGQTCFRVMSLPLDSDGRPQSGADATETGRFIACAHGFYDPVLYAAGRRITFVGTIEGIEREAVGNYQYPYPELAAQIVYLWSENTSASPPRPYYGPYYWGPWGPWGPDWWWSPWGYWPPLPPNGHGHPPPPPGNGGKSGAPVRRPLPNLHTHLRKQSEPAGGPPAQPQNGPSSAPPPRATHPPVRPSPPRTRARTYGLLR